MLHGTSEYESKAELSEDERHEVLSVKRRRLILDILENETTPIGLDTLESKLATRETGVDEDDEEAVERVALSLHHVHLPKMVASGILDYDTSAYQITQ